MSISRDNIGTPQSPQKGVNASVKEVDRFLFAYCIIVHAILCQYIGTTPTRVLTFKITIAFFISLRQ